MLPPPPPPLPLPPPPPPLPPQSELLPNPSPRLLLQSLGERKESFGSRNGSELRARLSQSFGDVIEAWAPTELPRSAARNGASWAAVPKPPCWMRLAIC